MTPAEFEALKARGPRVVKRRPGTRAATYIGIGKTKTLALIRAKRLEAKLLDGRIRVTPASCQAFLAGLPGYSVGNPVRSNEPAPPSRPKPKHGRRKVRRQ